MAATDDNDIEFVWKKHRVPLKEVFSPGEKRGR
jgi:hypothetical protein